MSELHHAPHAGSHSSEDCDLDPRTLHRIADVRKREGVSLRGIARRLHIEVRQLRKEEQPDSDLRLSDLYRWQQALQVPVSDLLVDADGPLSTPVIKRAQMIKLMKTVDSIREHAGSARIQRMAEMLAEQLVEIMPELDGVSGWPSVGQRRNAEDCGVAATRALGRELSQSMEDD